MPLGSIDLFRKHGVAHYFYDWLEHSTYDDYWMRIDPERNYKEIDIAALHVSGWYDNFLEGTIRNYLGFARKHGMRAGETIRNL